MKAVLKINKHLSLREAQASDIEDYLSVPFNEELLRMYGSEINSETEKQESGAKLLIAKIIANPYEWVIDYDNLFIGQARLTLDETNNKSKFAIGIFNPQFWNRGIGTQVTQHILEYAFNDLGLHKVYLRVLSYNYRAINSYKNAGFIIEGSDREGSYINGNYETDLYMSILYDEFKSNFINKGKH
ncbi:MAG: GNAT family N-acetyltransferase [Staphylococcus equorum]|uniref:GNAT family N-acetyltransferase n=1 Tax=Staphylococcus TaxID=1279 RepID=UPI0025528D72|nr:GNAT family protein [Staphylococcus equorum]MDK9870406.1 GNAT family protein [Staphylococcus equorum]MDK9878363.1 GNAT family protein [Staphylococcus equorum]MDN6612685.1 GNAT family N-acetyltransferase [Staphylococcus equorum]